jgi:hypothetical protein
METAARKFVALRSYRVATRLQSLQPAKHPLNRISVSVEEWREAGLPFAIGLGRDVGQRAVVFDLTPDSVGVVALVRMHDIAIWKTVEQRRASAAIRDLAAGQQGSERAALSIGQRADLGRATASRAANGLIFLSEE